LQHYVFVTLSLGLLFSVVAGLVTFGPVFVGPFSGGYVFWAAWALGSVAVTTWLFYELIGVELALQALAGFLSIVVLVGAVVLLVRRGSRRPSPVVQKLAGRRWL
jgi:hypothetical protein